MIRELGAIRYREGVPGELMASQKNVVDEVACLVDVTREDLVARWIKTHGHRPPKGVSRRLLELSAAYSLQVKAFGDLKSASWKALATAIDGNAEPVNPARSRVRLKPGSRLVRVWNGRTHHVEVIEQGFIWNDQHYRSLTAIAQAITGARWSGPRFFGL